MPLDLGQFRAVLLDLDGTIYHEEHPLPGAIELIRSLQAQGRPYACLSNSTTSPQAISQRLGRMTVKVDPEHIYTAAAAACDYVIDRHGEGARVFNLSTDGVAEMLEGRVQWVQHRDEPCDAVVAGCVTNVHATDERQRSALALLRNGSELVGICADRVYPSPRGIEFGSGAFCAFLGYAANVTPIFCGKPQAVFFQKLCERIRVKPGDCVLIGDNLESDIAGGNAVGMKTVLTLTGIAKSGEVERLEGGLRPWGVVGDLRELL